MGQLHVRPPVGWTTFFFILVLTLMIFVTGVVVSSVTRPSSFPSATLSVSFEPIEYVAHGWLDQLLHLLRSTLTESSWLISRGYDCEEIQASVQLGFGFDSPDCRTLTWIPSTAVLTCHCSCIHSADWRQVPTVFVPPGMQSLSMTSPVKKTLKQNLPTNHAIQSNMYCNKSFFLNNRFP